MLSLTAWTSKQSETLATVGVSDHSDLPLEGRSDVRILAALRTAVVGRLGRLRRVTSSKQCVSCLFYYFIWQSSFVFSNDM